jgi:hypothetical protein
LDSDTSKMCILITPDFILFWYHIIGQIDMSILATKLRLMRKIKTDQIDVNQSSKY